MNHLHPITYRLSLLRLGLHYPCSLLLWYKLSYLLNLSILLTVIVDATVAVLVASNSAERLRTTTVLSSWVSPSLSSPLSLRSVTSFVFCGEDAVASTVLTTLPLSTACCVTRISQQYKLLSQIQLITLEMMKHSN